MARLPTIMKPTQVVLGETGGPRRIISVNAGPRTEDQFATLRRLVGDAQIIAWRDDGTLSDQEHPDA